MNPSFLLGFFSFLFSLFFFQKTQAQSWQWYNQEQLASGNSSCNPQAIATDATGNVYITGSFYYTVTIGSTTLSAPGSSDMYLAKYSPTGSPLWAMQFGATTTYNEQTYAITTDTSGNVYVGGCAQDPFTVGTVNITPSLARGFILKFNGNGTCLWSRMLGSSGANPNNPTKLLFDKSHNLLLVGGIYWLSGSFGSISLSGNGAQESYIASIDPVTNTVLWAKTAVTSTGSDIVTGLCMDDGGNIFVNGSFGSSTVTIGNQNLSYSNAGCYIAKFTHGGTYINYYASVNMSFDLSSFNEVSGNIVIAGRYLQNFTEGTILMHHFGQSMQGDLFLCAFDTSSLLPLYYTTLNGLGNDYTEFLFSDTNGIYFTLKAGAQMVCQTHVLNSPGNNYGMVYMKFDENLGYQWSRLIYGNHFSNKINAIASGAGALYIAGTFKNNISFNDISTTYNLSSPLNTTGFLVRLSDIQLLETGRIKGWVFRDNNADGVIDPFENPFYSNVLMKNLTDGFFRVTDSYGHYSFSSMPGNNSIDLLAAPSYYNEVFPSNHQPIVVPLLPYSTSDSINFGLQPIPGINDLEITITGMPNVRDGVTTRYYLNYANWGTDTMTGYIHLRLDPLLGAQQAVPPFDSIIGNNVYWGYNSLIPFETRYIYIDCGVPLLQASVNNFVVVEPVPGDSVPVNNYDTLHQVIIAPHDPNLKEVFPSGTISQADVTNGIWLDYTIHFQNTGTDTAFNVVVRDTLDNLLDLSTIHFIGASAPFTFSVEPGREMVFRFDSISLPDSTTDELASNGFIRYRIQPLSTAMAGQTIYNNAFVFFDYELPIETNSTATPIQVITSITSSSIENGISIYPNPCEREFMVHSNEKIIAITVFDVSGREYKHERVNKSGTIPVSVEEIASGMVLVKVETNQDVTYFKLLIK